VSAALLLLLLAAAVSLVLTPLTRTFARARGWMDEPDGQRKLHRAPVPRIGGLAVFAAFVLSTGSLLAFGSVPSELLGAFRHLVVACAAVMAIGLVDDVIGVRPIAKLAVQTAAAAYLFVHGYRIDNVSNPFGGESVSLGWLALPVTLLWFVGMSNAFNLIDGLDGLAAGIGFFSTITLFIAAVVNERWEVVLLSAALGGALLGFLRYNFSPASIFLGDSGALFVGFALAAFAIRGWMKSSAAIAVAAPLLALAIPILDATIAVARRLLAGQSVFTADGDHIHHRLLRKGLTPQRVVVTLYGAAALFGALSLLTMTERSQVIGMVVIASSVMTWIGIQQLGYAEFGELPRLLRQGLLREGAVQTHEAWLARLGERFAAAHDWAGVQALLIEMAQRLGFSGWSLALPPAGVEAAWTSPGLRDEAPSARDEWTLPLHAHGAPAGTLVLRRRLAQPAFDVARLLAALEAGLGRCCERLAQPPEGAPELASHATQVSPPPGSGHEPHDTAAALPPSP
jgi:UDP-GlcNAc:undecaprenyl-phosphate GlcNAc-1-phosphate transferase